MGAVGNRGEEFTFRPAMLFGCTEIPATQGLAVNAFQNDHIQRPRELHRLVHQDGAVFMRPVKIPHTAQIARGKAGDIGINLLQIRSGGHGSAFLGAAANLFAYLAVQLHLRHSRLHGGIQRGKEVAVINGFSDVHVLFLSGAVRLFLIRHRENTVSNRAFPCVGLK